MQVAEGPASSRTIAASVGFAFLAFVVTAGLLHATIRDPLHLHADIRSEKLVILDRLQGKVFSAAFGSSHVHNGFDPRVFDATLSGSPAATRTANLAVAGGSQSEQYVMAQQFLKQLQPPAQVGAPSQPCLVMLEMLAGVNFTNDHLVHPRAINIYDWRTTRLMTHFGSAQMGLVQRTGRIGYALVAMSLHYANVGMLSNEIFAPPLSEEILTSQTEDDRRGQWVGPASAAYQPTLKMMIRNAPRQPTILPGSLLDGNVLMVQQLASASAVNHVSFAYIVMPTLTDLTTGVDYPDHLTAQGPDGMLEVPIINLARADLYPELYKAQLWYDEAHLDETGARLGSRILAEQLKKWYAAHGGPTPCG